MKGILHIYNHRAIDWQVHTCTCIYKCSRLTSLKINVVSSANDKILECGTS